MGLVESTNSRLTVQYCCTFFFTENTKPSHLNVFTLHWGTVLEDHFNARLCLTFQGEPYRNPTAPLRRHLINLDCLHVETTADAGVRVAW